MLTGKNHYKTSWHGKAYYFFGDYLQDKYSCRVQKLPINAGFSCPNRDGSLATEGCIFCSDEGSAAPTCRSSSEILLQMVNAKNNLRRHTGITKYIAYFQAFTNTASSIDHLKEMYDSSLSFPDVTGLMIATRPDCLPDDVLDLISTYNKSGFELWLEIGMQSCHNKSLEFLCRHHTNEKTIDAVMHASQLKIPVCVHVILGIPGETWADMMETAVLLSQMPVQGVKIHHLHVISGTRLANIYCDGMIKILSLKEYVSCLCDFLERLRPDIVIHRIVGDREEDSLIAPRWSIHKGTVQTAVDEEFKRRGTWQGFLYE